MKNRGKFIPLITYMVILFAALSWLSSIFSTTGNSIPYSEVVSLFRQEQVKSFQGKDRTITMELHNEYKGKTKLTAKLADVDAFRTEMMDLIQEQKDKKIITDYDFLATAEPSLYSNLV